MSRALEHSSGIVGVQYGLLTPETIRARSVVEVKNDLLRHNGCAARGGVADPALGSTGMHTLCSTCAEAVPVCPGHSGHIELRVPVLNVLFLKEVRQVLGCVCFHCSAFLLDPADDRVQQALRASLGTSRLRRLAELAARVRQCPRCGGDQPKYVQRKSEPLLWARFPAATPAAGHTFTPAKMVQILRHIPPPVVGQLGLHAEFARPDAMVWRALLVPPISIRPSRSRVERVDSEDDLTRALRNIVKANVRVTVAPEAVDLTLRGDLPPPEVDPAYLTLASAVATYEDGRFVKVENQYGKDLQSLRERLKGPTSKRGRFRGTIFGKRLNYSARTVITPDTSIALDEVGVPQWICEVLTFDERVTAVNRARLQRLVRRGRTYPGANYVVDPAGKVVSLKFAKRVAQQLDVGWTVSRHLVNGDDVLFNRQPSLHKGSLMAHRVRVFRDTNSFRLHLSATVPYNADFDGDEMALQVVLTQEARAEARTLLSVRQNMVKDGRVKVGFQQHTVVAAYLLTRPEVRLEKAFFWQLCQQNPHFDLARLFPPTAVDARGRPAYTGLDLISVFLPPDLELARGGLEVRAGRLVAGRLTKKTLNDGLVYVLWKDYGPDCAADFVSGVYKVLEAYLAREGLTIALDDCLQPVPPRFRRGVARAMAYMNARHAAGGDEMARERDVAAAGDKVRELTGNFVLEQVARRPGTRNGLHEVVLSGAKGTPANIMQISALIGQQSDYATRRINLPTSHFRDGRDPCRGHGFIPTSFMAGMGPNAYWSHLVGSRIGLVDTAVKTADTGYSNRKICKAMEDLVVDQDKVVRLAGQQVVQLCYGLDGWDSTYAEVTRLRGLGAPEDVLGEAAPAWRAALARLAPARRATWVAGWEAYAARVRALVGQVGARWAHFRDPEVVSSPVHYARARRRAAARFPAGPGGGLGALELVVTVEACWRRLVAARRVAPDDPRSELLFRVECAPPRLAGLAVPGVTWLLAHVVGSLERFAVTPHESVGMIAAQNCSEPLTQLTLNRFHKSGQFTNVVSGVARMQEIIGMVQNPRQPTCRVRVRLGAAAAAVGRRLTHVTLGEVLTHLLYPLPPDVVAYNARFVAALRAGEAKEDGADGADGADEEDEEDDFLLAAYLDLPLCERLALTPLAVAQLLARKLPQAVVTTGRRPDGRWWLGVNLAADSPLVRHVEPGQYRSLLKAFMRNLRRLTLRGIDGLADFYVQELPVADFAPGRGAFTVARAQLEFQGSNLAGLLGADDAALEWESAMSSNVREVEALLGIDAACSAIIHEWGSVMSTNGVNLSRRHIVLAALTMCFRGYLCPMTYQGIVQPGTSVIKGASFEKSVETVLRGGVEGHFDAVRGSMDSICWNQGLAAGTGNVFLYDESVRTPVPRPLPFELFPTPLTDLGLGLPAPKAPPPPPAPAPASSAVEPSPAERPRKRARRTPPSPGKPLGPQGVDVDTGLAGARLTPADVPFVPYSP